MTGFGAQGSPPKTDADYVAVFPQPPNPPDNLIRMSIAVVTEFAGRHYETGTIANWLAATGTPIPESEVLAASGGIAFGAFVFEYTGHLPHIALLTRNTFSPFERALDNLGIRRTVKETTNPEKGTENLRRELDSGHPVLVWIDSFSAPWNVLPATGMWAVLPALVVGESGGDFLVVDHCQRPFPVPANDLQDLRSRIKKDRNRITILDGIDDTRWPAASSEALATCVALFLEKPPAGSTKNFGISGMAHLAAMLRDNAKADGWGKKFGTAEKFFHAVAGAIGQPGIYDWIEMWGTGPAADRGTCADFLEPRGGQATGAATLLRQSAPLWTKLANAALPDGDPALSRAKAIRREWHAARWSDPVGSIARRSDLAAEWESARQDYVQRAPEAEPARRAMADLLDQIAEIEHRAINLLK